MTDIDQATVDALRTTLQDMTLRFERCAIHSGSDPKYVQQATAKAYALLTRTAPKPCNLPFERIPICSCDPGTGTPPTKQMMLECRLRGGPCRESDEPQEATTT